MRRELTILLFCIGLAVSGCGGSGSSPSPVVEDNTPPAPTVEDQLKMARADLMKYEGMLTAAGDDLMAQQAALEMIVKARMTINELAGNADTKALLDLAMMDLMEAQTAQLVAFEQVVALTKKVDGLTPETVKLQRQLDAQKTELAKLQKQLKDAQDKTKELENELNPAPMVMSPFDGFGIVKALNTTKAVQAMMDAAGNDPVNPDLTMKDDTSDPKMVAEGKLRQSGTAAGGTASDLAFDISKLEDNDGRLEYTVTLGDETTEERIAYGKDGTAIQLNKESMDDADVWVAAKTTFEKDATDYLTYGAWLVLPDDDKSTAKPDFGAFVNVYGNKYAPFSTGVAALSGTATFTGTVTGLYANTSTKKTGVFDAGPRLTANFGDGSATGTVTGLLTDPRVNGVAMGDAFILNKSSAITTTGDFKGDTTMIIGDKILSGKWGGQFFGKDTGLG